MLKLQIVHLIYVQSITFQVHLNRAVVFFFLISQYETEKEIRKEYIELNQYKIILKQKPYYFKFAA